MLLPLCKRILNSFSNQRSTLDRLINIFQRDFRRATNVLTATKSRLSDLDICNIGAVLEMAIRKGELKSNYTCIPNSTLRDSRLSAEATGVLAVLLSRHADWVVRAAQIRREFRIGKVVQQRIFRELKNAGYLVSETNNSRSSNGRWSFGIAIYLDLSD